MTIDEACDLMVSLLIQKDEPADRCQMPAAKKEDPAAATPEVLKCSNCDQQLAPGAKFCVYCGTSAALPAPPKTIFCQYCGAKLAPGMRFCAKCGKPSA
ncbi:zinc ribbon domain-containing protein [uncultured Acetobacterium sp.]|uniref:zinc ribbon domain-containing protein n=1 Tax=uncultured Acetobacterium sp. TaxID=217139 RepID=UPI0025D8FF3D|nr:zinc ribbon domain-containing protein [uncultured Acetobacterium sp.]